MTRFSRQALDAIAMKKWMLNAVRRLFGTKWLLEDAKTARARDGVRDGIIERLDNRSASALDGMDRIERLIGEVAASLRHAHERLNGVEHALSSMPELLMEGWARDAGHADALREKMDDCHRAMFANQVSLAGAQAGTRDLFTPWSNRKHVILHRTEEGKICLEMETSGMGEPVLVCSIPKAGTHFVLASLAVMGFKGISAGSMGGDILGDHRHLLPPRTYAETIGFNRNAQWHFPFTLQAECVLPGQYLAGHVWGEQLRLVCMRRKILFVIRDLRYATVSMTRMEYRNDYDDFRQTHCAPDRLIGVIEGNPEIFPAAAGIADLMREPNACLARFEELASGDREKMDPSVQALSRATGLDAEQVFAAVLQASNSKERSWSYTGQHSTLDGVWNEEVERAFAAKGYDVLNERLGYPRSWAPAGAE